MTFVLPAVQDRSGSSLLCNPNTLYCTASPSHHEHDDRVLDLPASAPYLFQKAPEVTTLMLLLTENPSKASHGSRDEDNTL